MVVSAYGSGDEIATRLDSFSDAPEAERCAWLVRSARQRWKGAVDPDVWWIHAIRFTAADGRDQSTAEVRVRWIDNIFEFTLVEERGARMIAGDRCRESNAEAVLDVFLVKLAGDRA